MIELEHFFSGAYYLWTYVWICLHRGLQGPFFSSCATNFPSFRWLSRFSVFSCRFFRITYQFKTKKLHKKGALKQTSRGKNWFTAGEKRTSASPADESNTCLIDPVHTYQTKQTSFIELKNLDYELPTKVGGIVLTQYGHKPYFMSKIISFSFSHFFFSFFAFSLNKISLVFQSWLKINATFD